MSGFKSQVIGGQREKFVRLNNTESSSSSTGTTSNRFTFDLEGLKRTVYGAPNTFKPSYGGLIGHEGFKTFSKSIRSGVTRAVFPEDLKVANRKVFDPQDKSLLFWNRLFLLSCIIAVSIDPLFFYLPIVDHTRECLGMDFQLASTITTLRTLIDCFYLIHMLFEFRTAYIAPSSRVFGRGELVIDTVQIAQRYLRRWFFVDFVAVLPLPQIVVLKYVFKAEGRAILETKMSLLGIVFVQYIFRFARFYPLTSNLKKTAGVFTESSWLGAAYYLMWYMLSSHIFGALWYLFSLERIDTCWQHACRIKGPDVCNEDILYCLNHSGENTEEWKNMTQNVVATMCSGEENSESNFDFGIYKKALESAVVESKNFVDKFWYCLWWGLQNLSTLGQGLQTSTYQGEVIFCIFLGVSGLILMALLIGNMQTYLQSLTVRLEEMRLKRRDAEQWMHHRLLPQDLRERVRRYNQYKWLETRGVDEESLVQSLPKDLRRDIKRHLCLNLVRRVPLFANMDERLLDAVCERLKPSLYTENTFVVREGDPVDEMLFIIRGRLESVTTDGGRSGFYNRGFLKEGDFCGEELLTWALDPRATSNLPLSTRTVKALTEVECFALRDDDLKFVAGQFRRLHSKQVQHTFRFYSQQWRTWAACFIQAAWRRHIRRKIAELHRLEEEDDDDDDDDYHNYPGGHGHGYGHRHGHGYGYYPGEDQTRLIKPHGYGDTNPNASSRSSSGASSSLASTFYVSKFARHAMRGLQRFRAAGSSTSSLALQKPPEPDFSHID